MTTLELRGRITETGVLEIQLPPGLPSGDVKVYIEIPGRWEESPWTDEEIRELTKPLSREEFIHWLDTHPAEEEWGTSGWHEE
jgi:hypothetical protein